MAIINTLRQRYDGFINAISGVGTPRDLGSRNQHTMISRPDLKYYNAVYAQSALYAKIIDLFPEAGLRKWIDYTHDRKEQIDAAVDQLDLIEAQERAAKKERKDGGSVVYCDVDDGQEHDQPLNLDRVTAFNAVTVFEGEYVSPMNPDRSGLAEVYQISGNGETMYIHRSRLLMFDGIEVADDCFSQYPGMTRASISARVLPSVQRYEMVLNNMGALSAKMLVGVWKMFDLNQIVDGEDNEDFKGRLEAQRQGVSLINDVVIDSQDEYALLTPNLTGLNDILQPAAHNLVAVSGIPHTVLLGESPGASLGASGGSQERDWNKAVSAYQESNLRANIQKALNMICAALKTEPVVFTFNSLDEPDLKSMAETRKIMSEADSKYIADGVLLPEEIRKARFDGGFSVETQLNDAAYMQELALDRIADEQATTSEIS